VIRAGWRATTPSASSGGCERFIYGFVGVERRGGFHQNSSMERNPFRSLERQFENLQRQFEAMGDVWDGEQLDVRKTGIATSRLSMSSIADRGDEVRHCRPTCRDSKATISTFGSRATRYTVPPSTNERSTMRTSTTCRANARDGPCTGPSDSRNRSTKTPSRRRCENGVLTVTLPRAEPTALEGTKIDVQTRGRRDVFVPYDGSYLADAALPARDRVRRGARCGHRRGYRHPLKTTRATPETRTGWKRTKRSTFRPSQVSSTNRSSTSLPKRRSDTNDHLRRVPNVSRPRSSESPTRRFRLSSSSGSDNAGQIVTPVTSVAGNVAKDAEYDAFTSSDTSRQRRFRRSNRAATIPAK